MKVCSKCGEEKDLSCFSLRTDSNTYRNQCNACEKQRLAASHEKHREKRLAKRRLRYEQNKEHEKAVNKAWVQRNLAQMRSLCGFYRAAKLKATPAWLNKEDRKQMTVEYALARWCSKTMGFKYEVDHIVPLQGKEVCGLHVPWNLRVIPQSSNRSKSNRLEVTDGC